MKLRSRAKRFVAGLALILSASLVSAADYDLIVRGGTVYDGTGGKPRLADVGIRGDKIAAIGDLSKATADRTLDAKGLAVAPGFINMLSWSVDSLIHDGKSQGDIRQGVTTEIFGEGQSMGPWSPEMKRQVEADMGDIKYAIEWTTLAEYLQFLERKGVSTNVASYIGAATLRELRDRPRQQEGHPGADGANARAGARGDESRRSRHRDVADLRPRRSMPTPKS